MSDRTQLLEELARAPDGVASEVLAYVRKLVASSSGHPQASKDYFEAYWNRFYGSMEAAEWHEPAELPFETREAW